MARQRDRQRSFCFTYYFDHEWQVDQVHEVVSSVALHYCIGVETCPRTNRRHLQGFMYFKNQREFSSIHDLFDGVIWVKECKGSVKENIRYCAKEGDYFICDCCTVPPPKEELKLIEREALHNWQKDVVALLGEERNDREIVWIYEPEGGVGKTALVKFIVHRSNALVCGGSINDAMFAIANWRDDNCDKGDFYQPPILFNLPREKVMSLDYSALESLKDGVFCNTKYKSRPVLYNSPHLLVFANLPPDRLRLSADRWKVYQIVDGELVAE